MRCQKCGWNGGCLSKGEMSGLANHKPRGCSYVRSKTAESDGNHWIADLNVFHAGANRGHNASAFTSELSAAGIHAQRIQNVPETNPGRNDLNFHFTRSGRFAANFFIDEIVKNAALTDRQLDRFGCCRCEAFCRGANEAGDESFMFTEGDLFFRVGCRKLHPQVVQLNIFRFWVEVDDTAGKLWMFLVDDLAHTPQSCLMGRGHAAMRGLCALCDRPNRTGLPLCHQSLCKR